MLFLLFCLAVIGLTHIVVDSHLSWKLKHWLWYDEDDQGQPVLRETLSTFQNELHFMSNCYQCSGLWAGLLLAVPLNSFSVSWYVLPAVWAAHGLAGSYLSVVGAALINFLDVVRGGDR